MEERASLPPTPTPPLEERKPPTSSGDVLKERAGGRGSVEPSSSTLKDNSAAAPKGSSSSSSPSSSFLPKASSAIEDEFDKFFSRYKKPAAAPATLSYSRSSPCSPNNNTSFRRASKDSAEEGDGSSEKPPPPAAHRPPRKSRFLRPDFYDTPREESKYVIQNEKVRAFRERSLSRQRDLSRNRSANALTNGWNSDYLRSKTCSIADKMDSLHRRRAGIGGGGDFRRTFSEDRTSNDPGSNVGAAATSTSKYDLSRSNDLPSELETNFQKAKRKSLILQNELENEVRKTQNMYSKLSGLMSTLNDNEDQYEKKLEKLYGLKKDKSPARAAAATTTTTTTTCNPSEMKPADSLEEVKSRTGSVEARKEREQLPPKPNSNSSSSNNNNNNNNNNNDYDNLSLLDKKYAYFRKLRNNERDVGGESAAAAAPAVVVGRESKTSTRSSSPEKDACSWIATGEEADNSDACSMLSDGTDFDNINDRIRRRSFYTRFNSYNNPAPRPTSTACRPSLSYSRSMSADVGAPRHHRSSSVARSSRRTSSDNASENDPHPK